MFDDVLLLGKGGRTVYLGPTNKALSYFEELGFQCPEHSNPADFFMDIISGSMPRKGIIHDYKFLTRKMIVPSNLQICSSYGKRERLTSDGPELFLMIWMLD
jgi:hypothetical protein